MELQLTEYIYEMKERSYYLEYSNDIQKYPEMQHCQLQD